MNKHKLPVIYEKATTNKSNYFFTSYYHLPRRTESFLHYHHVLELGICLSGSGELLTDKERIPYARGDAQLIFPGYAHYNVTDNDETVWLFINIDPSRISSPSLNPDRGFFVELCGKINKSGIFSKKDNPEINALISDVASLLEEDLADGSYTSELLTAKLAVLLITLSKNEFNERIELESGKHGEIILPAIRCINASLKEGKKPSLKAMAEACFLSESYFRKLFTSVMGEAPKQYVIKQQAEKAAELLLTTSYSVSEIAESCGFLDNSTFYRCFIKIYGVSPSEYRNAFH